MTTPVQSECTRCALKGQAHGGHGLLRPIGHDKLPCRCQRTAREIPTARNKGAPVRRKDKRTTAEKQVQRNLSGRQTVNVHVKDVHSLANGSSQHRAVNGNGWREMTRFGQNHLAHKLQSAHVKHAHPITDVHNAHVVPHVNEDPRNTRIFARLCPHVSYPHAPLLQVSHFQT